MGWWQGLYMKTVKFLVQWLISGKVARVVVPIDAAKKSKDNSPLAPETAPETSSREPIFPSFPSRLVFFLFLFLYCGSEQYHSFTHSSFTHIFNKYLWQHSACQELLLGLGIQQWTRALTSGYFSGEVDTDSINKLRHNFRWWSVLYGQKK